MPIPYDEGTFINPEKQIILCCHVDDISITRPNDNAIKQLEDDLRKTIKIQYLGLIREFLGLEIERT